MGLTGVKRMRLMGVELLYTTSAWLRSIARNLKMNIKVLPSFMLCPQRSGFCVPMVAG
jgi:hypothetical protein